MHTRSCPQSVINQKKRENPDFPIDEIDKILDTQFYRSEEVDEGENDAFDPMHQLVGQLNLYTQEEIKEAMKVKALASKESTSSVVSGKTSVGLLGTIMVQRAKKSTAKPAHALVKKSSSASTSTAVAKVSLKHVVVDIQSQEEVPSKKPALETIQEQEAEPEGQEELQRAIKGGN